MNQDSNITQHTEPLAPIPPAKKNNIFTRVLKKICRGIIKIFNLFIVGPLFPVILVGIILIRIYVAEPFLVYGSSMEPNFETGDYIIVDELSYKFEKPKRGDVVVLRPPFEESRHFIKRIIGLPGETISVKGSLVKIKNAANPNGFVLSEPYIKFQSDRGADYKLNSNEYFVMGDNRDVSSDSRVWGPLPSELITGKAFLRVLPFKNFDFFPGRFTVPQ